MSSMKIQALCILIIISIVSSEDPKEENGVVVLTNENFEAYLKSKKVVLVEFYAPWCGHCKQLAPEYEKAAGRLAARDSPLPGVLAKVDATVETGLAGKYEVKGYPTLKLFRDGEVAGEFDGSRTADGIVEFMVERADPNYKPPPPAAVTLTTANFSEFIEKHDYLLVEFYAPWCGHCKQLAPVYEKAAKQLKKEDPPIPLAIVDASKETDLATKHGVNGYPTLKVFRKGKSSEYKGSRDEQGIVDYMIKHRRDAYQPVSTIESLKKLLPEDRPMVLGYFPDPDSTFRRVFIDGTNEVREDYVSALTESADVAKVYGMTGPSFVLIQPDRFHSKYESPYLKYDKVDATVADVKAFIQKNDLPLVGHWTWSTMKFYEEIKDKTSCVVFYSVDFSFDHRGATQLWRKKLLDVANDFKDSVVFSIANDEEQEDKLKEFGLAETGVDMNIGCKKDGIKYGMPEMDEYDADHIRSFVNDVLAGKAKPFYKSQPLPKQQTGPVTVVVANNMEKMLKDPKMDVLIEFYAPWCGHCKEFEPAYAAMAKRLSHIKTLRVAKMDATSNDILPGFKVKSFPTIYFQPAGEDVPVMFDGTRSAPELITFMEKHAKLSKDALKAEAGQEAGTKAEKIDDKKKDEL